MTTQKIIPSERFSGLDALRGASILLMVLSGSIAFGGVLPAWMYHAQVPPPNHVFDPSIPGISWVDLVFPLFLFSMGMAIPLSLQKKIVQKGRLGTVVDIVKRFALLSFFAIFTMHARAWVMEKEPTTTEQLLSLGCFILLFLIYGNWDRFVKRRLAAILQYSGILMALIFLFSYPFYGGGFQLQKSDIIILVLANMALFGSLLWLFTQEQPWLRIGALPFIMAIMLASDVPGSWNSWIFQYSPAPWLYKFHFLKYLFIIIPGTVAGDWLINRPGMVADRAKGDRWIAMLSFTLVVTNIIGLFSRQLLPNLFFTLGVCIALLLLTARVSKDMFLKKLVNSGVYLLLLGLFFEAFQGGIKKDPSGYSYYFVTTGLAFFCLSFLLVAEKEKFLGRIVGYLSLNGKNPMIAYTAGNLLVLPLLKITGLYSTFNALTGSAFQGLLRGVIFTLIVSIITVFFTQKKLYWKS